MSLSRDAQPADGISCPVTGRQAPLPGTAISLMMVLIVVPPTRLHGLTSILSSLDVKPPHPSTSHALSL